MCRAGQHAALECIKGEELGRRWGTWMEMDNKDIFQKSRKEGDKEVKYDAVEEFFAQLDL